MMPPQHDACSRYLLKKAICATVAANERIAAEYLDNHDYHLIFLHCPADKASRINATFDLLAAIKARTPELPVLMTIDSDNYPALKPSN